MSNAEFFQLIHFLTQLVVSQTTWVTSVALFPEATRVGQFMRLSPLVFTGPRVEKDP